MFNGGDRFRVVVKWVDGNARKTRLCGKGGRRWLDRKKGTMEGTQIGQKERVCRTRGVATKWWIKKGT